jgi:hypothetical protein
MGKIIQSLLNRLSSNIDAQLICDVLYFLDQHTINNFEAFNMDSQISFAELLKRLLNMSETRKEKKF